MDASTPMFPLSAVTRTGQVYAALRADILNGVVVPGTRLRLTDLTERYECSMTVVRESLTRLSAEGLVQAEPQHGFRVTPISLDDLEDLTEARCEIEGLVLRSSIERGDLDWEHAATTAFDALCEIERVEPAAHSTEAWTAAHREFHEVLTSGCPNGRLRAIATSLRDSAELYRRWSSLGTGGDRDVTGEHRQLLDAALARDAHGAAELLRHHLRETARSLIERSAAHLG